MPAASALLVERLQDDLFALTWWDFRGNRREEVTNRRWLSDRVHTLTMPSVTITAEAATVDAPGMDHAP
jgi:hypothetical protein